MPKDTGSGALAVEPRWCSGAGAGPGSPCPVAVVEGLVGPVAVGGRRAPGKPRALPKPVHANATK